MASSELATLVANAKTVLESVETDSVGTDAISGVKFQQVLTYPTTDFTGLPAAMVFEDDNDSDFETQNRNERVYALTVMMVYGLELPDVTPAQAWATLRELYPRVLDAFDNSNDLDVPNCIVEPATAGWGVDSTNMGLAVVGSMRLRCKLSVPVTIGV